MIGTSLDARLTLLEEHVQFDHLHDLDAVMTTFGAEARYGDEPWSDHLERENGPA